MPRNLTLKLAASASYDAQKGCLRIVASAPVPDRDDEVVDPRTIRLSQYRANPVVIWSHDQQRHPVAKCEDPSGRFTCALDGTGRLVQEWYFARTKEGREVESLYRDKILRGASIGFLSDGLEDIPPDDAERLYGVRKRLKRHIGGELLETSAVPVPSCPGALALEWVDAAGASAVMARRGVGRVVTKGLSVFLPSAQATAKGKMRGTPQQTADRRTRGATAVSTTATTTDTAKTTDVTAKAMDTLDDTAGGSTVAPVEDVETPHPHENVKAGIAAAMHSAIDQFTNGEMTWEECQAALDSYSEDHGKYSDGGEEESDEEVEDTDVVEKEEGEDDSEDDEEMKAVSGLVTKAVAAATAPLVAKIDQQAAEIATLKADVKDLEDAAEAILSR